MSASLGLGNLHSAVQGYGKAPVAGLFEASSVRPAEPKKTEIGGFRVASERVRCSRRALRKAMLYPLSYGRVQRQGNRPPWSAARGDWL